MGDGHGIHPVITADIALYYTCTIYIYMCYIAYICVYMLYMNGVVMATTP